MIWLALFQAFISLRLFFINEFLIASIVTTIGAIFISFYFFRFKKISGKCERKSLCFFYVVSISIGLFLGGMYSVIVSQKYYSGDLDSYYSWQTHLSSQKNKKKRIIQLQGIVTHISASSILIETQLSKIKKNKTRVDVKEEFQNDKILRLRILNIDKNFLSTLNIDEMIQTSCQLVNYSSISAFTFFEILQGRNFMCRVNNKSYRKNQSSIVIVHRNTSIINYYRSKIKKYLNQRLKQLSENTENKSLASGFLLADTSDMDLPYLQLFRKMGIAHLFSASGLHLGLLYAIIFLPFMFFRLEKTGMILGWIFSLFFLILLDFRIPLLRAFLFLSMYLFFKVIDKKTHPIYILFFASAVIEFIYPLSTFSISFILSVGVTGIIILFYKPILSILSIRNLYLKNHLALTLSAFTASIYLSYFIFGYIQPLSLLYNFILVPFAGVYLFSVLLYIIFPFVQPLVSLLDNLYYSFAQIHYYIWDVYFPKINFNFFIAWASLLFIYILYVTYYISKKQKWIVRKYFYYYLVFFFITFFLPFIFYSYPQNTFKAFPYGVMEYNNNKINICGYTASFLNKNNKYLFKMNHLPVQKISSHQNNISNLYKFHIPKFVSVDKNNCLLKKGIIVSKNNCYVFENKIQPEKWNSQTLKHCQRLFFIHSRKSHPQNKNYQQFFSVFGLNSKIKIQYTNYFKWF